MRLAFLTTCMARLGTLMSVAGALRAELEPRDLWVLSDWSCPDNAGEWLERFGDSRIHVVRTEGQRYFHKTGAIQAALARALDLGATHVCHLDADTMVRPGFRAELGRLLEPGAFVLAALREGGSPQHADGLTGLLALESSQARRLTPWRLEFRGYGGEDYWARLACLLGGLEPRELRRELCEPLGHSDRARGLYQPISLPQSWSRNMALVQKLCRETCGKSPRDVPGSARMFNLRKA